MGDSLIRVIRCFKIVAGFSRYQKYTLGAGLRNQSRAVVGVIIRTNASREKAPVLLELRVCLDELLLLVRLAKEVKAFKSFKAYQFALEQVVAVCRQNEAWLRSVAKTA